MTTFAIVKNDDDNDELLLLLLLLPPRRMAHIKYKQGIKLNEEFDNLPKRG